MQGNETEWGGGLELKFVKGEEMKENEISWLGA